MSVRKNKPLPKVKPFYADERGIKAIDDFEDLPKTPDKQCFGSNYKPDKAPSHDLVREAVETLRQHLEAEWISDGCKADHAFGCASCQAVFLLKELDGVLSWLEEIPNESP